MEESEESSYSRVCITGGSGYIGSSLVKKLLQKGYTVHATLRNLGLSLSDCGVLYIQFLLLYLWIFCFPSSISEGDAAKVDLLKSLPNAANRLLLFQADIYNPTDFEPAIKGCQYVFHVATPMRHDTQRSQYKDTAEAAIAGVRSIADSCIRSQTVKRLIYTSSLMASSPLTEDGASFKSCMDESCWTPFDVSFTYANDFLLGYTKSKTLAEKEVLKYNEYENSRLEVVSLPCGLVGGETLLPYASGSVETIISPLTSNLFLLNGFKFLQELWGSIALVHIEDICQAHIFCMEKPSMKGRFICAATNATISQIAVYFQEKFPEYEIAKEYLEGADEGVVRCDSTKLMKMGFEYLYDEKKILDDSVACGKRCGALI